MTRPLSLWRTRRSTDRLLRELAETGQLVPPLPRREDDALASGQVTIVSRQRSPEPESSGNRTPDVVA